MSTLRARMAGTETLRGTLMAEPSASSETPKPIHTGYVFADGDAASAAASLDSAFAGNPEWYEVVDALRGHTKDPTVQASLTPLQLAIQRVALFALRVSLSGEPPGCQLGPQWDDGSKAYPARIAEIPVAEVQLWEATSSLATEPQARARLHDLLFERGGPRKRDHAASAAAAYQEAAAGARSVGMATTEMLVRAWTLTRGMQLWDLHGKVRTQIVTTANAALLSTENSPGLVLPLLAALSTRPTRRQPPEASAELGNHPTPEELIRLAIARYKADHLLAELFGFLRALAIDEEARTTLRMEECEELLALAKVQSGLARQAALEGTIRRARALGFPAIADQATRLLQQISVDDLGLQVVQTELVMPRDWIERYVGQFSRPYDWRTSLGYFRQTAPPTGTLAELEERERATRGRSISRLVTRVHLTREGLPKSTASSADLEQAAEINWLAGLPAAQHANMLAEALDAIHTRYGELSLDDLTDFLSRQGQIDRSLARVLARAFTLFWVGDYHACVHIIIPQVESAARALLLELDEAVYQVQVGNDPGGYGGLYSILTALEALGLDRDWAFYLKWLLVTPGGPNLRNDIAHGLLVDSDAVTAAHALRAATLLIDLLGPDASTGNPRHPRSRDSLQALLEIPVRDQLPWPEGQSTWLTWLGGQFEIAGRRLWRAGMHLRLQGRPRGQSD